MTDLTPAVWREIELNASMHDGTKQISLPILRNILRKSRRTTDQNALLWSLYEDILRLGGEALAGFTKDELHEFFLIDYFGSETKELFGRKKLKPLKRSSRLTKMEFSDFVEHIVRFAAEKGIVLKLPGEQAA
jgi:hypothetical protein